MDCVAPRGRCDAEAREELVARLGASVQKRLVTEVPIGLFFSGAVDSNVVCALAAERASEQVRSFSIGFPERRYDERDAAAQIARHLGTEHRELRADHSYALFNALVLELWLRSRGTPSCPTPQSTGRGPRARAGKSHTRLRTQASQHPNRSLRTRDAQYFAPLSIRLVRPSIFVPIIVPIIVVRPPSTSRSSSRSLSTTIHMTIVITMKTDEDRDNDHDEDQSGSVSLVQSSSLAEPP